VEESGPVQKILEKTTGKKKEKIFGKGTNAALEKTEIMSAKDILNQHLRASI